MNTVLKYMMLAALLSSGCHAVVVEKPDDPPATLFSSPPGPSYVWIGNAWIWDNQIRGYVLQEGHWEQPKKKSAVWVDGHWKKTRGGWKYVKGHWRR